AIIIALTLSSLVSPVVSFAAPKPANSSAPSDHSGSPQAFSVSGRIDSVNYTANVIVVRAKHGSTSITLTPTTSVELGGGQQGSIADLRPGMHVRVRGSIVGGVMTAESIVVR
ncbi:MAG TPA: DUF5666 domain-containing protein, partial [Candidatus Eremiobacteraceae bacterium]|nr:DUF5666 domain-containing protein [Candidatus Eremiobacteraceae bacterium]